MIQTNRARSIGSPSRTDDAALRGRRGDRLSALLLLAIAAAALPVAAGEGEVTLSHPTAASGGGVIENGPFRLYFTVGEPVAGPVSQAQYTLIGGLQATFVGTAAPLPDGGIFSDSFEAID